MIVEIPDELYNYIMSRAEYNTGEDIEDFNPMEYSGGNFDDAYGMGLADGKVLFCRDLVKKITPRSELEE